MGRILILVLGIREQDLDTLTTMKINGVAEIYGLCGLQFLYLVVVYNHSINYIFYI